MQDLLRSICRRHHTAAVLVTHDIDEALLLADRVVLIGGTPGRLVGDWNIQLPEPRADSVRALAQLRLSIVEALHQARKPPVVAASESLIYEI